MTTPTPQAALEQRIAELEALVLQSVASNRTAIKHASSFKIRAKEPEVFHGRLNENVDRWLFNVDQYFRGAQETDDTVRVPVAASLLRGTAQAWWETVVRDNEKKGLGEEFCTWNEFKAGLAAAFRVINREDRARSQLSRLRQVTSVTKYAAEFTAVVLDIPDISDSEKYARFYEGLKKNVRVQLEIKGKPRTYGELLSQAESIDNILYDPNNRSSKPLSNDPNGPAPMELGAAYGSPNHNPQSGKRFGKLTPEVREELNKKKACLYCREVGCPGVPNTNNCPKLKAKHPK